MHSIEPTRTETQGRVAGDHKLKPGRIFRGTAALFFSSILGILVVEAAGRVLIWALPSYEVVFLQPHPVVGWTMVPNLQFAWAGYYWWGPDFRVDVRANAEGFRDLERNRSKASGTTRIALLGDSFVEAIQVPLEATAGQLLEKRLNAAGDGSQRFEVLNFGVSSYGVGQYLLAWEEYASRFAPDHVFVFVAGFHMDRTVRRYEPGGFRATAAQWLWVRPTFRLVDGLLVREPARDFDAFVAAQERILRDEFGEDRSRRRETGLLLHYARAAWSRYRPNGSPRPPDQELSNAEISEINLEVLRELGAKVKRTGARLGVVDVARYFDPAASDISQSLIRLAEEEGFGYVVLAEKLLEAERSGRSTRWRHDAHFNLAGNQIFADTLYAWLKEHPATSLEASLIESRPQ